MQLPNTRPKLYCLRQIFGRGILEAATFIRNAIRNEVEILEEEKYFLELFIIF
jgi:hypothetical protein